MIVVFFIAVLTWLASSVFIKKVQVRIVAEAAAILVISGLIASASSTLAAMTANAKTSNSFKNFTHRLVEITSSSDLDLEVLKERLSRLNTQFSPSYEDSKALETAVSEFLNEYGFDMEDIL